MITEICGCVRTTDGYFRRNGVDRRILAVPGIYYMVRLRFSVLYVGRTPVTGARFFVTDRQ